MIAFVGLAVSSNGLAFLKKYPFGGIRQHLFASPLLILATVSAGMWLLRRYKYKNLGTVLFILFVIIPNPLISISQAYSEVEDITSPVSYIDPTVDDKNVFVYYGAIPAIKFHYPHRNFYISKSRRDDIESMFNEVVKLGDERFYLVFSHIYKDEDIKLLSRLTNNGFVVLDDKQYAGSRLVQAVKALQSPLIGK